MLFSILIPTLKDRQGQFNNLYQKLRRQITEESLNEEVEILSLLDNKDHTIGLKRNKLIERAEGKFIAFVDDDDTVSDNYVSLICSAIKTNPDIDCIGIKGQITFRGKKPRIFIHSLQYTEYFTNKGTFFRPPYHLNPIKRDIAKRYKFADVSYSEDIDWAMRLCRDHALQKEFFIDQVIYYYHARRLWYYQYLLDQSEPIRHALGLKLSNRIRVRRWINLP
jgi:glycosyltransferase involved in cell wall biosynthesis